MCGELLVEVRNLREIESLDSSQCGKTRNSLSPIEYFV